MAEAKRDSNYVTTLIAVSNVDGVTPVVLYADPTTHRLLVSATMGNLDDLSDVVITSGAQGDILYHNGTNWVNLSAGTAGKYLKTAGAGANPLWDTPTVTITGTDTHVMFFDGANTPAGDAGMTYNKSTDVLTLAGDIKCDRLGMEDTNASHYLYLIPGSDLTADHVLTITTGDADRIITISGDLTIESASLINQDLTTDANVQFATVTVNNSGLHILDTNASHDLIIAVGSDLTGDKTLTITTGDSDRTISLAANFTLPADPNADKILFWDDTAGATAYLGVGNSISITDVTIDTIQDIRTTATPQFAKIGIGAAASGDANELINLAASGNIVVNGANPKRTIVLTSAGGWPSTTAGCAANAKVESSTNKQNYYTLDFDKDTDENAEWSLVMPDNWDASTLTAIFYWTFATGTADETVAWAIQALAYANSDAIDGSWGTAIVTSDAAITAGDVHISAASDAITVGGSPAGGQFVQFRVYRDVSADNLAGDARLMAVKIEYGISQFSD